MDATTENISASGLLFGGDHLEAPETPVEITLLLPSAILGSGGSQVICRGRIVRTVPAAEGGKTAMAAAIVSYRFVPGGTDGATPPP